MESCTTARKDPLRIYPNFYHHIDDVNSRFEEVEIHFVNSFRGNNPYIIKLSVNNKQHDFEIDTGPGRTIMSEYNYYKYFHDVPLTSAMVILKHM